MNRYWKHLVTSTEHSVEDFLAGQVTAPNNFEDGRMFSDIIEGKQTIYLLTNAVALYCLPESRFYQSESVYQAIDRGLSFVERWQRPDGSLDYPSCNFYSAPDTAFCFRRLIGAWEILKKYGKEETHRILQDRYLKILLKCSPILLYGGFHTPNHRWAVTAALLQAKRLVETYPGKALNVPKFKTPFKTPGHLCNKIQERIDVYLAEGIDGNDEGEFAERSTGNYNAVVDKCLISMFEETGMEYYLEFVERNLEMMLHYFDPDDTVFTLNSTRQDQGAMLYADQYFYLYTYMADKTKSPIFDRAAHKIIKDNLDRGAQAPDCLYLFLLYRKMAEYRFSGYGFLSAYNKHFRHSDVLRFKSNDFGYTVLNQNKDFLHLCFGSTRLSLKIGESYCDTRNFVPDRFERNGNTCYLESKASGWYYQPFDQNPGTSDWWQMEHHNRQKIITSSLTTVVIIKELEKGLEITVSTDGLDRLPLRVEIDIPAGVSLETDCTYMKAAPGESMVLRSSYLYMLDAGTKIKIGPGYGTHYFQGHYSDKSKNNCGFTIFFNDYTPYEKTFRIEQV